MSERVQHSGPHTKFCVLCLSGEHERIEDEPYCSAPNCVDCAPDSPCCETVCGVCPRVSAHGGCTMTAGDIDGTRSCHQHGMVDMVTGA